VVVGSYVIFFMNVVETGAGVVTIDVESSNDFVSLKSVKTIIAN
jgi:hypothetical protein